MTRRLDTNGLARTAASAEAAAQRAPLLVLGLGNRLLRDDGFGLELLERLRSEYESQRAEELEPRQTVDFVDGGTLATRLLAELEGRRAVLILDALSDPVAGRVQRLDDPMSRPAPRGVGAHGANASGLLAAAWLSGDLPESVVLVGAAPLELHTGIGLSPRLQGALPQALELARATLDELRARLAQEPTCTS